MKQSIATFAEKRTMAYLNPETMFAPCSSRIRLGMLVILLVHAASAVRAQSGGDYVIRKSVIASGGGSAEGGAYRVTGTIGQHGAASLSGGDYNVTGGFWAPSTPTAGPPDLEADPTGTRKSRFVSFVIPPNTSETAIRVRLFSLHHVVPPYSGGPSVPFTSFEGQIRWVGPPTQYLESNASGTPFLAAVLQCTPHYQDWSTVGLLHVTGSAVVPSSIYEVENVAASCVGAEASCAAVSVPLVVGTTRWGDVETPYNPPAPSAQPDLGDISALVNKFRSAPGAPIKARALLVGTDAIGTIDIATEFSFIHIAACVDAFRGRPYPHTIPNCP